MLCLHYVRWCNIAKKWPLSRHEAHKKNNFSQYTSCLDEHMKARMLEVHMAMTGNQFLVPKNWFVHLVVHHKPKIVIVTKDQTIMVIHHKPIWPLGAFDCGTNGLCEGGAWGLC